MNWLQMITNQILMWHIPGQTTLMVSTIFLTVKIVIALMLNLHFWQKVQIGVKSVILLDVWLSMAHSLLIELWLFIIINNIHVLARTLIIIVNVSVLLPWFKWSVDIWRLLNKFWVLLALVEGSMCGAGLLTDGKLAPWWAILFTMEKHLRW